MRTNIGLTAVVLVSCLLFAWAHHAYVAKTGRLPGEVETFHPASAANGSRADDQETDPGASHRNHHLTHER